MKKRRILGFVLNPDCFKAVFLSVSVLGVCPLLSEKITPFLKLLHLYALLVLAVDLFTEQRILHNKGRFVLVLFAISYAGTLLTNTNLINLSGLSNFAYLLAALGLVYSYGKNSKKADWVSGNIVCVLISAANLIGIWMFFTKYFQYYPEIGYIGMFPYENRLCGMFGNPNVLGMVSLSGIFISGILFVSGKKKNSRYIYFTAGMINLTALLMSNSRTQIYSLIFACGVFAFLQVLKGRRGMKGAVLASGAAVLTMALAFGGMRLAQMGLSAIDANYNYYLEYVSSENASLNAAEPTGAAAEPTGAAAEPTGAAAEPTGAAAEPTKSPHDEEAEHKGTMQTILRDDSGLNGRPEIWLMSIPLIEAKPLFGIGLDNHNYAYASLGMNGLPMKGNLHNVYLDVLVCCGLAGFTCLFIFLLIMLCNVVKFFKYSDGQMWTLGAILLASIAGFILDGVADSTLIASVYPTAIAFWFIASQLANLVEQENIRTNHHNPDLLGKIADHVMKRFSGKNR